MSLNIDIDMTIEEPQDISMTVEDNDEILFDVSETLAITDHSQLLNRDADDSHPISAITGLEEALAEVGGSIEHIQRNGTELPIADKTVNVIVPEKTSDLTNDTGYITSSALSGYVPTSRKVNGKALSGDITLAASDVGAMPSGTAIPSKTSDLTNDSGYITASDVPVKSVNGRTGVITGLAEASALPTKTSDLTNDSGFITSSDIPPIPSKTSDLTNDSDFVTSSYVPPVAKKTQMLYYGELDSTSTSTVMTAQVDGITELKNGVACLIKNGVVTSASGFTLNVNSLGAKPVYSSMAATTRVTSAYNIAYTWLFVYDEDRVTDGCWVAYYGYYTSSNTIGYQLRTNSSRLPMKERMYRYRLFFTSADGEGYVPANTSTSTNATSARTPSTEKIDPFGRIAYYGTTAALAIGDMPSASYQWDQYLVTMGYSFTPITMDDWKPVYLKTTPQADGSVVIDPTHPYVQALPTTDDGFVYIFLGVAISTTQIELFKDHPCYWYKDGGIRQYTGQPYIPEAPTTDGTYTLTATVTNGVATYSWT